MIALALISAALPCHAMQKTKPSENLELQKLALRFCESNIQEISLRFKYLPDDDKSAKIAELKNIIEEAQETLSRVKDAPAKNRALLTEKLHSFFNRATKEVDTTTAARQKEIAQRGKKTHAKKEKERVKEEKKEQKLFPPISEE